MNKKERFLRNVVATRIASPVLPKMPNLLGYRGRDEFLSIPSRDSGNAVAPKKPPQTYTGTLIKGIGVMHKSNLVPVLDEQQAKDLATMRRN